ncbi:major facilitator superfamily domain-containing protein [Aspergillus sergii]|uniref:Major facilitator superfamily domain-containing protein n=1 Tax=Aspergillus sergii TaxID=1034303 RepID=A0A5N6WX34_9EURO|nr:major facilitator superfamily domain-containing protein [Aspergillus sergii]
MHDDSKAKIQDDEHYSIEDGAFHCEEEAGQKPISIQKYAVSRLTSLKPPMNSVANPFKLLAMLNAQQWAFLAVSFLAWSWDSFDYFTVSLTVSDLAETFGTSASDITWGITLVLMLRSVGSIMFGIFADRYGRKWPFIINNVLFIVLELGTGFCETYHQFLAVRALFGIAMGGLYGIAAVTALEDCPEEARGLIAGLMQQGYAFGYLLATAFARALVNTTSHGWRPYFWFAACPPVLIIAFRLCLPETQAFRNRQAARESCDNATGQFISDARAALRHHWLLLIYMVLLTSGLNFVSHGSQDLYPTMLENDFNFSSDAVTVTQVVANLGAMTGGTTVGYCSQIFGRRFSMILICIVGGALVYPYTYTRGHAVIAVSFFEQFCVQGAWSVIPIYLLELSPVAFQTFVVGSAYQFGNLASSASSTIESTIGERFPLPPWRKADGTVVDRYHYGKVMCIFMGAAYAYSILLLLVGPEKKGRSTDGVADREPC